MSEKRQKTTVTIFLEDLEKIHQLFDYNSETSKSLLDSIHENIEKLILYKKSLSTVTQTETTSEETIPPCHYRAITEKGQWYCGVKLIPKEVCLQQQSRYLYMKRQCRPEHLKQRVRIQRSSHYLVKKQEGDDFSRAYGKGTTLYGDSQPLPFACPKGWNRSKCAQYPCDRRPQCKQEGIIA